MVEGNVDLIVTEGTRTACCGHKRVASDWHSSTEKLGGGVIDPLFYHIRVFHDKEIWRISVRISDRSKVTQYKINFVKNGPQWGLNSQHPDHQSSGINRAWLYKGLSDSQRQPNSDLAQWQSLRLMIWWLWVQTPLGAFLTKFIMCCIPSDLSDNLTETCIVKNSNVSWSRQVFTNGELKIWV